MLNLESLLWEATVVAFAEVKCIVIKRKGEKKWAFKVESESEIAFKSLLWEETVRTIAEVGCIVIESESEQKLTIKVESESEIA